MTILRTIHCNFRGCEIKQTEEKVNDGWAGWGSVKGKIDKETGSDSLGLCPEHCNEVYDFIIGGK